MRIATALLTTAFSMTRTLCALAPPSMTVALPEHRATQHDTRTFLSVPPPPCHIASTAQGGPFGPPCFAQQMFRLRREDRPVLPTPLKQSSRKLVQISKRGPRSTKHPCSFVVPSQADADFGVPAGPRPYPPILGKRR